MPAETIMIQGTGSHVGKSIFVTALCRIFSQDGYKTAPFKSQNMSLNSFATPDGKEISIAQAVQAEAACTPPVVEMNPLLLKPSSHMGAQVVVNGKPIGHMSAEEYIQQKHRFLDVVKESLTYLLNTFDVVVIEGAGSPAEINLKDHDIVNMKIAELANAPVILVGDIDKGGVFAALVGTLELLEERERERVKGVVINKFRGDRHILQKGLDMFEEKTGVPVVGVLPYIENISIYPEDSLSINVKKHTRSAQIKISVIRLPMVSNFTDFEPFKSEHDIDLCYVTDASDLRESDVIIIPGTKNTINDLLFLRSNGYVSVLEECRKNNKIIIGICGGYQMLGRVVVDTLGVESKTNRVEGLGFLNTETYFKPSKTTEQVTALLLEGERKVTGYEIHMGETRIISNACSPLLKIIFRGDTPVEEFDGAINNDKTIWGTYLHGLFENNLFRRDFLNTIREKKGLKKETEKIIQKDLAYDRLAELVRTHVDVNHLPL